MNERMTIKEAQALIEENAKRRAEECLAEIETALKTYQCAMVVRNRLENNQIISTIDVVPQ